MTWDDPVRSRKKKSWYNADCFALRTAPGINGGILRTSIDNRQVEWTKTVPVQAEKKIINIQWSCTLSPF